MIIYNYIKYPFILTAVVYGLIIIYSLSPQALAMTTSSPSSNPVLASISHTSNTDSKQQNSQSSASYAYYYYY